MSRADTRYSQLSANLTARSSNINNKMDVTVVAPVQRMQLSRFASRSGWELSDMSVDSTRVAVSGYNRNTLTTFIDLFTLNVSDSTPLQQQHRLFSREFPPVDSVWRFVSLIDGDSSHIVTVCRSHLDLYNIHSNDDHRTAVIYRDGEANCVAVSETGDIYIGLIDSNEVIVFDGELNIIKSITLNGMERDEWPGDITVKENNLFISTDCTNTALRYNMDGELLNQYNKPDQHRSEAVSITVSSEAGLVFVFWWRVSRRHVVSVFSLAGGHSLFSFDVDLPLRPTIRLSSKGNRLMAATDEGELRVYNTNSIFTFSNLKKELSSRLTVHDCMELGKYFQIPLDKPKECLGFLTARNCQSLLLSSLMNLTTNT